MDHGGYQPNKTKLFELGEYVKGMHEDVFNSEETIKGVNDIFLAMCKHCVPIKMQPFTFNKFCLEGGNCLIEKYRWYPGLVRVYGSGSPDNPDSLALGVSIYSVSFFRGKETHKSDFFLTYDNMKHSPETIEAYEKCMKILPELIVAYVDHIIETMEY
jgi:hypothetical protein